MVKTIGIVLVAFLASILAGVLATITETWSAQPVQLQFLEVAS